MLQIRHLLTYDELNYLLFPTGPIRISSDGRFKSVSRLMESGYEHWVKRASRPHGLIDSVAEVMLDLFQDKRAVQCANVLDSGKLVFDKVVVLVQTTDVNL